MLFIRSTIFTKMFLFTISFFYWFEVFFHGSIKSVTRLLHVCMTDDTDIFWYSKMSLRIVPTAGAPFVQEMSGKKAQNLQY